MLEQWFINKYWYFFKYRKCIMYILTASFENIKIRLELTNRELVGYGRNNWYSNYPVSLIIGSFYYIAI